MENYENGDRNSIVNYDTSLLTHNTHRDFYSPGVKNLKINA
jgi:hypothetical protein